MRGFLHIFNKNDNNIEPNSVKNTINILKEHTHRIAHKSNTRIDSYYYTNEDSERLNSLNFSDQYGITLIGQYMGPEVNIIKSIIEKDGPELDRYISNMSGVFAIAYSNFQYDFIKLYMHISRIENVFYSESNDRIVIGTDPIIVSAISSTNLIPETDINNIPAFLTQGHFTDETTVFKNVQAVPPNSKLTVSNNQIDIKLIDGTFDTMSSVKATKDVMDDLKEEYLNTFKILPDVNKLNIGLTGGKDSRLSLLGLLHNNFNVNAVTRGFEDHPDVIIAKQIAEILRIEHSVNKPKLNEERKMIVNPMKKSLEAMKATSGQVYGYENIALRPEYKGSIGVTGVAALTLKGGYGYLANTAPQNSAKELIRRFSGMDHLLVDGASQKFHEYLKEFSLEDFQMTQLKHAVYYMNGRWTSDTRLSKSYSGDLYSPFYDNQLIKKIIKIQHDSLANGYAQYTLTKKLNPEIANLPLASDRWPFEKNGPRHPKSFGAWLKRSPQYPKTLIGNYNWRKLSNPDGITRQEVKDILLSSPNHSLYNIVSFKTIEKLLNDRLTGAHDRFLWACLSVFVYFNYLNQDLKLRENIKLTIPQTNLKEKYNSNKLIDLTHSIKPLNKSVSVKKNSIGITVNATPNKNLNWYVKLFDGKFESIPTDKKSDIDKAKTLRLHFNIESQKNIPLKFILIYYNESSRISSSVINFSLKKGINTFDEIFKVPPEVKYFRSAINVSKSQKLPEFKVNYAYGEIKY